MSYATGQLGGISGAEARSEPRIQLAAREAGGAAHEIANRLDRVLTRLRTAPPRPIEKDRAEMPQPNTLDAAHQNLAAALSRAHDLLSEIEGLV